MAVFTAWRVTVLAVAEAAVLPVRAVTVPPAFAVFVTPNFAALSGSIFNPAKRAEFKQHEKTRSVSADRNILFSMKSDVLKVNCFPFSHIRSTAIVKENLIESMTAKRLSIQNCSLKEFLERGTAVALCGSKPG